MKKVLLLSGLLQSFALFSNYQAEHYIDIDAAIRYQTMEQDFVVRQFGVEFFQQLSFQPLIWGILTGVHPYSLLAIQEKSDHAYVLIKSTASYVFLFGNPDEQQCAEIKELLSGYKSVVLLCRPLSKPIF